MTIIRILLFWGALAATCAFVVHAGEKSVVVIYGGEVRSSGNDVMGRVLRRELGAAPAGDVTFYEEFLDNARFPGPEQETLFAGLLTRRYAGKAISVLVAIDPTALNFLIRHRDGTFPGVPVVFAGVRTSTLHRLGPPDDFIGVPLDLSPGPTVRMALALRPEARNLVVVTGTAELDLAWERAIRALTLPPHVRARFLTGLSVDAIERELAGLGRESVVVLASFRRDGSGQVVPGSQSVLQRVRNTTGAPIFHMYDIGIGQGATGTYSTPVEQIAAQAGIVARQLANGTLLGSVHLPPPAEPVPVVDWREFKRWQLDESLLPPGTELRNRPRSVWEEYRDQVVWVALLILAETILLAALLIQALQRRRVERRLRESRETMRLAGSAAQLVMWTWDVERDVVWTSDEEQTRDGRPLRPRTMANLLGAVHGDDQLAVQRAINRAIGGDGVYDAEYRVVEADGTVRWYAGRGRVEQSNEKARWLRGITLDITRRKNAELDAMHQRNELAHLSRVTLLGELSSSVAHELNQPLMAILSNAQAARMFMQRETIDLVELGSILDDIVENDKRAGEIIWSVRKMLKKEELAHEPIALNDVVSEVLRLMRSDLMNRGVTVHNEFVAGAPMIVGDRIQLQQVLLNVILNACEAMAANRKGERVLRVRIEGAGGKVRVKVIDRGCGIAPESLEGIFKPFFTTKANGLGLGLSVCSSIMASHGGALRAANNPDRGATFTLELDECAVATA